MAAKIGVIRHDQNLEIDIAEFLPLKLLGIYRSDIEFEESCKSDAASCWHGKLNCLIKHGEGGIARAKEPEKK